MPMFLTLIQHDLCPHRDALVLGPGPAIHCRTCQATVIANVYEYINRPGPDDFLSSQLA